MERPLITEFMGDGFTLEKAHKQYLDNIELWNYVQALDKYCDYLLTECDSQKPTSEPDKALGLFGVMPSIYGIFQHGTKDVFGYFMSKEDAECVCETECGEDWYVDSLIIEP